MEYLNLQYFFSGYIYNTALLKVHNVLNSHLLFTCQCYVLIYIKKYIFEGYNFPPLIFVHLFTELILNDFSHFFVTLYYTMTPMFICNKSLCVHQMKHPTVSRQKYVYI